MGKAAQWIKNFLTGGRKERPTTIALKETRSGPLPALGTRERRRWSFTRSATGQKSAAPAAARGPAESDDVAERKRHSVDAAAAAVAVRAAELSRQHQAAVIRLTATATETVEEDAAVKIQSFFRSYLARRALCALRGLVKLQALIRGHLVRRQTTATIRSMQALATAQSRARTAQRIQMIEEAQAAAARHTQNSYRKSLHESLFRRSYEMEENVKIVEMDHGESRSSSKSISSYMYLQTERRDLRLPTYYSRGGEVSPARADLTDRSPRAASGRFEYSCDLSAKSQEHHPMHPNYMANTQSSRAKARSHSAPKQRPGGGPCGRTAPSGRRPLVDGKNAARGVRKGPIRLDRSSASLQESECGSTSTNYCSSSLMAIP